MKMWTIILIAVIMGQQTTAASVSMLTPATTDELVDYVLTNKFYYFDNRAQPMEDELDEMLEQIKLAKNKVSDGDSKKLQIYTRAQDFTEKYMDLFKRHKFQCGVRNVFQFMSPVISRVILATNNEDVAIHWYNHFKMFVDQLEAYEKSAEATHDVIRKFTRDNRSLQLEYDEKYTRKANQKCNLGIFMNEIH
ncbi:uncharacterized protein LOC106091325 [Stomoxys calcitrans]|uniref:uncharacterized protein LOC106091325 n=1 Tax=Stomoxys calcitrans TaxID=35570 RepID=UPI0027E2E89E|nr:uncharacterized protein LOC106091325 [Stomoxys calcitrans]